MRGGGFDAEGGGGGPKFEIKVRREKEAAASVSMAMVLRDWWARDWSRAKMNRLKMVEDDC